MTDQVRAKRSTSIGLQRQNTRGTCTVHKPAFSVTTPMVERVEVKRIHRTIICIPETSLMTEHETELDCHCGVQDTMYYSNESVVTSTLVEELQVRVTPKVKAQA